MKPLQIKTSMNIKTKPFQFTLKPSVLQLLSDRPAALKASPHVLLLLCGAAGREAPDDPSEKHYFLIYCITSTFQHKTK